MEKIQICTVNPVRLVQGPEPLQMLDSWIESLKMQGGQEKIILRFQERMEEDDGLPNLLSI